MGNSLYGSMSKGISNKMKYNIEMGKIVRMEVSKLSTTVMAIYTISTVRSPIEIYMKIAATVGGKIVSRTTDGFITETEDLEKKNSRSGRFRDENNNRCFVRGNIGKSEKFVDLIYSVLSEIREELSGDPKILVLKYQGKNLTLWTTRGQISSRILNQENPQGQKIR